VNNLRVVCNFKPPKNAVYDYTIMQK
jgi:hypothetical protein